MKKVLTVALAAILSLCIAVPVLASPDTVDLIADGGDPATAFDAGDITVTYDGTYLDIVFTTTGHWTMMETHVYVGEDCPTKSAPGRFPYKHEGLGGVTSDPYDDIPLPEGVGPGDTICIAAQAAIENPDEIDPETGLPREESAWAEGDPIRPNKNWAMCFQYTIPE